MDLKKLLGEELFNQVQAKLKEAEGDVKLLVNDGNYIPRERLNEKTEKITLLEGQLEESKNQLAERDNQLEQLKNDSQASEQLKARITELESQNKKTKKEYEARINQQDEEFQTKLEQQKFDSALELALRDAEAKNPKAVKALLDTEKIKLDGDKLLGFEDQLKALKENDSYLFGQEKIQGKPPTGGGKLVPPKPTPEELDSMSDADYFNYRLEKND